MTIDLYVKRENYHVNVHLILIEFYIYTLVIFFNLKRFDITLSYDYVLKII